MKSHLNNAIATWGYLGRIPIAPGTWGSLGGLFFIYMLFINWEHYFGHNISLLQFSAFTFAFFLIGVLSADKYDKDNKTHDSKQIVIDEVVGMMVTCLPLIWLAETHNAFLAFGDWIQPLLAFLLFRFFDILKPWPISIIDKNTKGGFGVMIDDVLAGIAAAGCFLLIGYTFHEFFPSY